MKTYTKSILLVFVVMGIVIGISVPLSIGWRQKASTAVNSTSAPVISVQTHASYIRLSREEMLKQADAIVAGQVTQVSATRFNQDSGELWEARVGEATPLALHYVEVQITEVLAGGVELEEKGNVTIAVLGTSSMDSPSQADHQLKPGDQVIVFLQSAELAWREGTRPVWRFVAAPAESALALQSDGLYHDGWRDESPLTLEDLEVQIAQQRLR